MQVEQEEEEIKAARESVKMMMSWNMVMMMSWNVMEEDDDDAMEYEYT